MFKMKTPHGFAGRHTFNVIAIFSAFAFISLVLTWGFAHQTSTWLGVIAASLVTGVVGVLGGVASTGSMRSLFNWFQTGRLIQWLAFGLSLCLGLWLSDLLIPGVAVNSYVLLTLMTVISGFVFGILTGVIPIRGRTWLPMSAGNKFRGH